MSCQAACPCWRAPNSEPRAKRRPGLPLRSAVQALPEKEPRARDRERDRDRDRDRERERERDHREQHHHRGERERSPRPSRDRHHGSPPPPPLRPQQHLSPGGHGGLLLGPGGELEPIRQLPHELGMLINQLPPPHAGTAGLAAFYGAGRQGCFPCSWLSDMQSGRGCWLLPRWCSCTSAMP